ncbi:DUF222 domain-containing protein [Gordonia malaquae]|uniref:DUF222 domain-containing protein n=1 Tax=Gordonia malaquae NBRC 108250 TaxID=1223542 RepID=M3V073_GORML|nr:DUF222 domain-containing protein [Gordonia malaquae]GAC81772.1 hypothetical protein GM1_044_00200 [Gordonia malaquae NBRC 108250]
MASTITGSLGVDTSGNDFDDLGAVRTLIADEAHLAWRRLRMIGEIAARREAAAADGDDMLLLNGTTVLGAEVAAVMSVGKSTGSALVEVALDARDRLPRVAGLLRDGLISFATFRTIVMQCTAVEDAESIAAIDADLAQELRDSGAVSWSTGKDTARRIVAEHDPDAEQVLLAKKAIDADAATLTCTDDPRSVGARRSDLAIARLTGTTFGCTCGNTDCPAAATAAEIGERFATVIVHVIADATTLNGESTTAGWMDGTASSTLTTHARSPPGPALSFGRSISPPPPLGRPTTGPVRPRTPPPARCTDDAPFPAAPGRRGTAISTTSPSSTTTAPQRAARHARATSARSAGSITW